MMVITMDNGLQQKFYVHDFIGLLCSKMQMNMPTYVGAAKEPEEWVKGLKCICKTCLK